MAKNRHPTSWEPVSDWYDKIVGKTGHDYHQHVIFPYLLKLFKTKKKQRRLLDLGCGQGVFSHVLYDNYDYVGVDVSHSLIQSAKKSSKNKLAYFLRQDICDDFDLNEKFSDAVMILSFQNIENPKNALKNINKHLKQGGRLVLIINHPCFRIPKQTSWIFDDEKNLQSRRVDSYMSRQKIPIEMHPGKKKSPVTYSYHHSLTDIFSLLKETGFVVTEIQELLSHKKSTGKFAKRENKARKQFPLFMSIVAKSL